MKKETLILVINSEALAKLHGVKVGGEVKVEARRGVPVSREWRNRLQDAAIDKCVDIKKTTRTPKKDK